MIFADYRRGVEQYYSESGLDEEKPSLQATSERNSMCLTKKSISRATKFMTTTTPTKHVWRRRNFEHCAQRKDPRGFWGLKLSGNRSQKLDLLITRFHENQNFQENHEFSSPRKSTLTTPELLTRNFPEHIRFTDLFFNALSQTGQKEIEFHRRKSFQQK